MRHSTWGFRTLLLLSLILFSLSSSLAWGDNWAHWRGPDGNCVAPTASPPTEWSASEGVKWKVAIPGRGSGSPIVWEDQVFVVSAVPTGDAEPAASAPERGRPPRRGGPGGRGRRGGGPAPQESDFKLFCFDRATGDLKWERTAVTATPHEGTHGTNGFASASPCTDGQHVYAHFGSRGIFCYTMDGTKVWERTDLGNMRARNGFGEGSSPTLAGDLLIVPWDHEGPSSIMALNKTTGKTVWLTPRDEPTCWATPLIVEHDGQQQIIMNGQNYARAYELSTGKELWRCGGQTDRPAASAVAEDGLVFIGSGYRGNFLGAFRLGGKGDIAGTDQVAWTIDRDTPDIASPLLVSGRLYFLKEKSGILTCVDAQSGKVLIPTSRISGLDGVVYASPVAAGGHIYLSDRNGTTVVIKEADTLEIVATNSIGETIDATPAPVDDELFIRGEKHLYCIAN